MSQRLLWILPMSIRRLPVQHYCLLFYLPFSNFRQAHTNSLLLFVSKIYQKVCTYRVQSTYLLKGTNKNQCVQHSFKFHIAEFGQVISVWITYLSLPCMSKYLLSRKLSHGWRRNTRETLPAALLVSSAAYIGLAYIGRHRLSRLTTSVLVNGFIV